MSNGILYLAEIYIVCRGEGTINYCLMKDKDVIGDILDRERNKMKKYFESKNYHFNSENVPDKPSWIIEVKLNKDFLIDNEKCLLTKENGKYMLHFPPIDKYSFPYLELGINGINCMEELKYK